jgi:hypothetical protein
MKLILAWLCLGSLATGQIRCALEGRIVDQKTGQPVSRAYLFAIRDATVTAIRTSTDEQGRFCFARLDAGSYYVVAQRTGYLEAVYRGTPHPEIDATIEIKPESRVAPVTIEMVPRPILVGTVVDADGEPLAHAEVRASSAQPAAWPRPGNTIYTDSRGAFRLYDLDPGNYHLTAAPPMDFTYWGDHLATGSLPQEHIVETPYPSAIVLEAGHEITDVVIRMQRVRLRRLSGKVVGIAGATHLMVESKSPSGGTEWRNTQIQTDGTFHVGRLLPGRCVIHVADEDRVVDLTNGDADGVLVELRK